MIKIARNITIFFLISILPIFAFCMYFDQAVLVRKGTVFNGHTDDKIVAITYDDGPSLEWTPKILSVLKENDVKATFFMVGKNIERYPEIARTVSDEGHDIGNHTYTHHVLLYYTNDELKLELDHTNYLLNKATGKTTNLFRPPKAWLTQREKKYIKALGYDIILWTLNSKDWVKLFSRSYIEKNILSNVKAGDIILFHDSGSTFGTEGGDRTDTVNATDCVIKELKRQGYRFVTVSELLQYKEKKCRL